MCALRLTLLRPSYTAPRVRVAQVVEHVTFNPWGRGFESTALTKENNNLPVFLGLIVVIWFTFPGRALDG